MQYSGRHKQRFLRSDFPEPAQIEAVYDDESFPEIIGFKERVKRIFDCEFALVKA